MNKRNLRRQSNLGVKIAKPPSYSDMGQEPPKPKENVPAKTIACYLCGKGGSTLIKDSKGYKHQSCKN